MENNWLLRSFSTFSPIIRYLFKRRKILLTPQKVWISVRKVVAVTQITPVQSLLVDKIPSHRIDLDFSNLLRNVIKHVCKLASLVKMCSKCAQWVTWEEMNYFPNRNSNLLGCQKVRNDSRRSIKNLRGQLVSTFTRVSSEFCLKKPTARLV